jgi:synaptobrevin family protein YKT6
MQVFKNDTKDAIELTGAENLKSINRWVQKGVKEGVR